MAKDRTKLVVDFGDVAYVDSSGVGMLVAKQQTLRKIGGDIRLVNLESPLSAPPDDDARAAALPRVRRRSGSGGELLDTRRIRYFPLNFGQLITTVGGGSVAGALDASVLIRNRCPSGMTL